MSEIKGRIIDHFYGGITRDEKSRIDGVALNVEELDIFENADFVQAAQIMTKVATPSSSPSSSPSASDISGTASPTGSPSSSPSASPSASFEPIALDSHTTESAQFNSATSTSWSHTCTGSNRLLIVSVYTGSYGTSGMSVTYNGVSMTLAQTAQYDAGTAYVRTFYLASPAMGSNTVSVSWSGSSYGIGMSTSYTGVSPSTPIDSSGDTSVSRTSPVTVTLDPTYYGSWWYGAAIIANTTDAAVGVTGAISTKRDAVDNLLAVGDSNGTISIDSQNGGFTDTNNNLTGVTGLVINAATSGSPSSSPSSSASGSPYVDMTYVGGNTNSSATGAEVTIDLTSLSGGSDTSPSEGDIVVLAFHYWQDANTDYDLAPTTSGYTELADVHSSDAYDGDLYVGYKVMGSTPDTSVVIPSNPDVGRVTTSLVYVWRGVDQTTPIDVTTTSTAGSNSITADPPSITPTTPGALVLAIGGASADSSSSRSLTGAPTGYSGFLNSVRESGETGSVAIAYKFWSGSGAEDPGAFTHGTSSTNYSWCAATVALRPAGTDNSPSSSPSATPSSSPSSSTYPQTQTEITAYTGDDNDNVWGYGAASDDDSVELYKLTTGGADDPGQFALVQISPDVTNTAFAQSPLQFFKTSEASALYYLKKNGSTISLARYDIDNDTEDIWSGSAWTNQPSPSPSPSPSASPSASGGESGTVPSSSQLAGLTGTDDRYFMRVEFGELYIGNGNYIAKVEADGTFTAQAFQLPLEYEAVDITFVSDVGLILARNINKNANFCKAFWWDLTSEVQFDNQITIPHGGPQWIMNFKERLYCLTAQNGVATFYSSAASPGVPLQQVPGMQLKNVAAETSTQAVSSQKMVSVKDGVLYFGLNKTDKTGIYAIGQMDENKPVALVLAKRFDTTDYSRHVPVALHTQGPNFYASYVDNSAFKHSRCESNNSPNRSSQAVYESVYFDEGDATKEKDLLAAYVTCQQQPTGTFIKLSTKADYGSFVQCFLEDGNTMSTAGRVLGVFKPKSVPGKTHQFKLEVVANGANSPKITGLAYVVRMMDTPAYG
jgi:hypothetical protein